MIVLVSGLIFGGCAAPAPAPAPEEEEIHVLIGGSGPGGAYYPLSCGLMTIINEHVPGMKATAIASGATANLRMMLEGEMFMCMWDVPGSAAIYQGPTPYFPEAQTQIRLIAPTHACYYLFATLDPEIKTWADIEGKKIAMGGPGTMDVDCCEAALVSMGLERDVDYTGLMLDGFEAAEALMDGRVDVMFAGGGLRLPCLLEVDAIKDIYFVRAPEDKWDQILIDQEEAGHAAVIMTVPKEIYRGLDKDYECFACVESFVTNSVQPEELVYKVTKALWENLEIMVLVHPSGAEIDFEKVKLGGNLPYHPGALRYYKEIGVLTEDPFKG